MQINELDYRFNDEDQQLEKYPQLILQKISSSVKQEHRRLSAQSQQLNFQDMLHLQLTIDNLRNIILQCNLAISQWLTLHKFLYLDPNMSQQSTNTRENQSLIQVSKQNQQNITENNLKSLSTSLISLKKILTISQVQLSMILFVIEHRRLPNFLTLYEANFKAIKQFIIAPQECMKQINLFVIEEIFEKQMKCLKNLRNHLKELQKFSQDGSLEEENLDDINRLIKLIKIQSSKLLTICQILPFACTKPIDDLFSIEITHQRWQKLFQKGYISSVLLADKITLSDSFNGLKNGIAVISAAIGVIDEHKNQKNNSISSMMKNYYEAAIKIIKCAVFKSEAQLKAGEMFANPTPQLAQQIWNLPEDKRFRDFIQLSLPEIHYSEVLYLPRHFHQYFQKNYNKQRCELPQIQINRATAYGSALFQKKPYSESIRVRINAPRHIARKYKTKLENQQERQPSNKNQALVSSISAKLNQFVGSIQGFFISQLGPPQKLVFHIHGGGFISMSSFIHQTYTRLWANDLNVPIVSVDYGKAPSRPFPNGLQDCLEAYLWTVFIYKQIFQINPKKIVIVGDSAGGNLVAALTTMLLRWNLPAPSGIVLVYPALNLDIKHYTPSLLTALNDMILPHTLLKICARSYLGKADPTEALVSPVLTQNQILAKYPHTRIFVGDKDPFHDDCCRFVQKINSVNQKKARLVVFQEFPHGFLQFDHKLLPNQYARTATSLVQKAIAQLLHL